MEPAVSVIDVHEADRRIEHGALLLDARSHRQRGLRFLAGATRISWTRTRVGGARSGLLPAAGELASRFAERGVYPERPVVVVGAGARGWGEGARVAWSLAWLGHPHVSWLPLSGTLPSARSTGGGEPGRWSCDVRDDLRAPSGTEVPAGAVVVDVRTPREHQGARSYGEVRGGHIPGACFLPFDALWTDGGPAAPEAVRSVAIRAQIPANRDLVCVCTGGVRSAAATLLLRRAGVGRTVCNHDGGMWAWSADPARPMAVLDAD